MWNYPPQAIPVGALCAYAGELTPESTRPNRVFSCSSQGFAEESPALDSVTGNSEAGQALIEATGWMVCDGRTLWVSKYPELYGALGTLYGHEGEGTFKIPDARGLFLRGVDSGSGMDPDAGERTAANGTGRSNGVGSVQCDAVQDHVHSYQAAPEPTVLGETGDSATSPGLATATGRPAKPGTVSETKPDGSPIRTSRETRPRNIAVHYLIRFR